MKMSFPYMLIIPKMVAVLYIILFTYAASSKLLDFDNFRIQLGQSPILTAYADSVAWGVPSIELLITLLFVFPKYYLIAYYSSIGLMSMFTTYIILVLNFSDYIPCSCGGVLEDLGWTEHIIFNVVFILLALIAILLLEQIKTQPK